MSLNVMVLESDRGTANKARRDLADAGHNVLGCHSADAPSFPCVGLEDQSKCPLRSHSVDLALTVRVHHRSQPTQHEDGVRCALMHRVPVVVAGSPALDPFEPLDARMIDIDSDIVAACEEIAAGEMPSHSRVATEALRASRTVNEAIAAAQVKVTRRRGCLLASVIGLDEVLPRQREAAIVRMLAKLREYDSSARGIDVILVSQSVATAIDARHST